MKNEKVIRMAKRYENIESVMDLLPHIYVGRKQKNRIMALDTRTNTDIEMPTSTKINRPSYAYLFNETDIVPSGSWLYCGFCKYDKELEIIMFASAWCKTGIGDKTKNNWVYSHKRTNNGYNNWRFDPIFITKDNKAYSEHGEELNSNHMVKVGYYNIYEKRDWLSKTMTNPQSFSLLSEFIKFSGNLLVGPCGRIEVSNPMKIIRNWFDNVDQNTKKKTNSKNQQMIDELTSKPLSDINKFIKDKDLDKIQQASFIDVMSDEIPVIRVFYKIIDNFIETYRTYLFDKPLMVKMTNEGYWKKTQNIKSQNICSTFLNKEDLNKYQSTKYIKCILDNVEDSKYVSTIIETIQNPIVEQLYKAGFKKTAKALIIKDNVKLYLNKFFGPINENGKTFYQIIGLNEEQLNIYEETYANNLVGYWCSPAEIIKKLKAAVMINDFSDIDIKTFRSILETLLGFEKVQQWNTANAFIPNELDSKERIRYMSNMRKNIKYDVNGYTKWNDTTMQPVRLLRDTVIIYNGFPESVRPEVNLLQIKTEQDIQKFHNDIIEYQIATQAIIDVEKNKEKQLRMQKIDENRRNYEYENEEYIIRLPKDLLEISKEGQIQHICIGGYCDRHANGTTNIFFLREKNKINKPFYAIEMDNNKRIVQIHGFGNKWLGNNPEVVQFVIDWLRNNKIKCNTTILFNTAVGYGRSNEMLNSEDYDIKGLLQ